VAEDESSARRLRPERREAALMALVDGRASDRSLRRLFDANVIGILICTVDGAVLEANTAFLDMVGYTPDDLAAGRIDWRALTPPEFGPADELALAQLAATGAFPPLEKAYVRKDGTRVAVSLGGARSVATDEVICYVVDRSAERAATERLQRSEARYRALADELPQVIMLSDANRKLIYANRYYNEFTGIPADELNERWREPLHPEDVERVVRARATGEPYEVEYRLRRFDGVYRWHYARCYPVPGNAHDLGWLATAIDIDDRKRAEETLQFLEHAGTLLSASLDLRTTFETLFDLVVPAFGDWALITLRDEDGTIRTIAARHREPALAGAIEQFCCDVFGADSTAAVVEVYHTGRPVIRTNVGIDIVRTSVRDTAVEAVKQLGFGSHLALPIFAGDRVIGSFGIVSDAARRTYSNADLPALAELARRAGTAIANARQFEREHRVASLMQDAALPRRMPALPGYRFDVFYAAGRNEANIGGDWYDALALGDGRLVISVGDVSGNGLAAAVTMSSIRQVIRGAAHVCADPVLMLDIADRTLRSETDDTIATAFVAVIDPARRTMHYACAGHVPPLLRTSDGGVTELVATGAPLGCRDLAESESRSLRLPPQTCLLLYTDGLIEWERDLLRGETRLRDALADGHPFEHPHPAKALVESLLPAHGAPDDVAAMMVFIA